MTRIYKEGQGKWSRGIIAGLIMLSAMFALKQLHDSLPESVETITVPLIGFKLDYRFLIHGPILIGAAVLAYWLFNRPATADFLIDTENELKNKVTWPSRKEEITSSIVVVVTVIVLGTFIFAVDWILSEGQALWYGFKK